MVTNNFDLQSIKFSDSSNLPANWVEEYFLGDHSDIGGAQQAGYQNKANDIGNLTLNRAIEVINSKAGVEIYKTPSANQQPSAEFVNLNNKVFIMKLKIFIQIKLYWIIGI